LGLSIDKIINKKLFAFSFPDNNVSALHQASIHTWHYQLVPALDIQSPNADVSHYTIRYTTGILAELDRVWYADSLIEQDVLFSENQIIFYSEKPGSSDMILAFYNTRIRSSIAKKVCFFFQKEKNLFIF